MATLHHQISCILLFFYLFLSTFLEEVFFQLCLNLLELRGLLLNLKHVTFLGFELIL
jgi:hypothetical protein